MGTQAMQAHLGEHASKNSAGAGAWHGTYFREKNLRHWSEAGLSRIYRNEIGKQVAYSRRQSTG